MNSRVQKLIKHIAIRRTKTDHINGKPIVDLPERRVVITRVNFNEDERKLYDAMHKDGKLVVCKYVIVFNLPHCFFFVFFLEQKNISYSHV